MKVFVFISGLILALCAASCGPAAEDREIMHSRAKTIADSMANLIKTAMKEAESPPNVIVVPDTSAKKPPAPTAPAK
jgi:hypothetical protein